MPIITITFDSFSVAGTGLTWSNTENAASDDDSYATSQSSSGSTEYLVATGGDRSAIPVGSTINSVTAKVRHKLAFGFGTADWSDLRAWIGGAITGANQITTPPAVPLNEAQDSEGSGNWSEWDAAKLRNTANGIAIRYTNTSEAVSVDEILLEVDYTPAATNLASATMLMFLNT